MAKYFCISGYWKEDKKPFDGYIVKDTEYVEGENDEEDENIFFYGLDEEAIKEAIKLGEEWGEDFVITSMDFTLMV